MSEIWQRGHVLERNGDVLRFADFAEYRAGAAVQLQRFLESVLAIENIRHVGVEPRQAEPVAVARKNLMRALGPIESLVVEAEIDQGLESAAERAPYFELFAQFLINLQGGLVALQRGG